MGSNETNNAETRMPSSNLSSGVPQSWNCTTHNGMMNTRTTAARIEKSGDSYSIFMTDSSDDTGPIWEVKDQLVAQEAQCKFSKKAAGPLYCESMKDGWATLRAEDISLSYVDQTSGEDKNSKNTTITVSGTSPLLKHYQSSVMKFSAKDCTRN